MSKRKREAKPDNYYCEPFADLPMSENWGLDSLPPVVSTRAGVLHLVSFLHYFPIVLQEIILDYCVSVYVFLRAKWRLDHGWSWFYLVPLTTETEGHLKMLRKNGTVTEDTEYLFFGAGWDEYEIIPQSLPSILFPCLLYDSISVILDGK